MSTEGVRFTVEREFLGGWRARCEGGVFGATAMGRTRAAAKTALIRVLLGDPELLAEVRKAQRPR